MATAGDDVLDEFLMDRGNGTEGQAWVRDQNKKQCPECSGLHELDAVECTVCGWTP